MQSQKMSDAKKLPSVTHCRHVAIALRLTDQKLTDSQTDDLSTYFQSITHIFTGRSRILNRNAPSLIRPGGGKNDRISLICMGRVRMLISLNLSMSMTVILTPFRGPSDAWINSDPLGKSMDYQTLNKF